MKNILKFLGIILMFLGIGGLSQSVYAEEVTDSLLDMDHLQQYVIQSEDGLIFDVEQAIQNQENEIVIEVGENFNYFAKLDDNSTEGKRRLVRAISIPIYGNYCGPGTDFNAAGNPIDQLDRYCMYHDLCYGANGWGNKQCDIQFVTNLTTGLRNGTITGSKAVSVANAAILYFANKG
ncbi:hypothetical protein M2904_10085 (plasmid) [Vagococcus lutrae]|uniref:phospholipase A2 family protein n=1 Tax=Vagococcus lutrae TaxID=81947 RepID=UPI0019280E5B|nr:phospholipase A2 family protein [Vagococcus lutrae]UQF12781.1 hypothetical protein M2919_10035 [Vagococcus lutrae]UQF39426.1 hypothetical protein M2904_10085 [Vagococcus lutrae]GEQ62541.1 hypothetical protein VL2N_18770 [Vagococcus lutrae]GEQ64434.1 hypothetical protein VL3N_18760 [Vagococcus lutrae]GEQ66325.1 hypothetical protein VL4N_18750 [Vagococcus lutrae]